MPEFAAPGFSGGTVVAPIADAWAYASGRTSLAGGVPVVQLNLDTNAPYGIRPYRLIEGGEIITSRDLGGAVKQIQSESREAKTRLQKSQLPEKQPGFQFLTDPVEVPLRMPDLQ